MDTSDKHALARMLASETREEKAKIVIGWITIQVAKRRKVSIYKLLTGGGSYGRQVRDGRSYYASTYQSPSEKDLVLAEKLLSGELTVNDKIKSHIPGAWVERGQGMSDQSICKLQDRWEEGIYGKIEGTKWILFSRDSKSIGEKPYENAKELLDNLKTVDS